MSPPPSSSSSSSPKAKMSLPLKTRLTIALFTSITKAARRPDGTINRRLLDFIDLKTPPNPNPINGVSTSDVTVYPNHNLFFRVFTPVDVASSSPLPVIVYFHGGGYITLSAASKTFDAFGRLYARCLPAVFVSVNYRLCPEHGFPSQYDDGMDVLRFLDSNPQVLPSNADTSKFFLCGDSAGGNISHHLAVRLCQLGQDPLKRLKLVGMILLQPAFGGMDRTESEIQLTNVPLLSLEKTDWCWKAFLPDGDRDHWAINVSGPNAVDLAAVEGFPEALVVIGGYDPLRDWQKRYYEWLKRCGKVAELLDYPSACHSFYTFPEVPESQLLVLEVKRFITKRCEY